MSTEVTHTKTEVVEPTTVETTLVQPVESTVITPEVKDKEVPALPEVPVEENTATRPNPTKRLSLFLGKAKHFVDKVSHPPKKTAETPTTPPAVEDTPAPVAPVAPVVAPVVASPTEETAPVAPEHGEETEAVVVEESERPKHQDKRKSFLSGLFRSKSPVKEVEKVEETHVKEDTPAPEKVEAVAVKEEPVKESPVAEAEHTDATAEVTETSANKEHKDNVIDQIKRGPLAKFFNKKKEPTEHKEETTEVTETTEDAVTTTTTTVTTVTTTEHDAKEDAPAQPEEKTSRPSSPLGRRITQMFRLSHKKKTPPTTEAVVEEDKDDKDDKEEAKREVKEEPVVPEVAPIQHTREVPKEEAVPHSVVQAA
ncbi:hypothetical protein BDB01DRAFT_771307 [Pilobolus umbonatus]|nr:hypothetical protein BDB01DRAFT_771307 [Pilobolus umbonatus]